MIVSHFFGQRESMKQITLRPYQTQLKYDAYNSWNAGNRNVLVQLSTGGGKSKIMSEITRDHYQIGQQVSIIAHRNELVTQMSMHVAEQGIPHRIIGAKTTVSQAVSQQREKLGRSFVDPTAGTAVIGVDTLIARSDDLSSWCKQQDVWLGDEWHHCIGNDKVEPNKWGKAVRMFSNARGIGFTATPTRADGQGLGREFDGCMDDMVTGPTTRWLIENNFLCDYEIVCPTSDLKVENSPLSKDGDWSNQTLRKAAKESKIVGDVVENYFKWALGRKAIVFATDVETADEIAQKFNEWGIRAASVNGKSNTGYRTQTLKEFEEGRTPVLVNVDLFDEGFDCLDTETEILTLEGWKNYSEIDHLKECYAWNSETGQAEVVPVLKKGVRELKDGEKMLEIKSQHTDIRVTEGHRIYYKDVNYYRYEDGLSLDVSVKTAACVFNDKVNKFALPLCAEKEFKGVSLSQDEIRVLGWYMTDGYMSVKNGLEISQVKQKYVKIIRDILDRTGFTYKETIRIVKNGYKPGVIAHRFYIHRKSIKHLLPYMDKKNPPKILNDMTKKQFGILWDTMMDGNGSRYPNKSGNVVTMFKGQADFITASASVRGFAVMYGTYQTENNVTIYNMRLRDKKWMRFYQKDKRGAKFTMSVPEKKELVWCVANKLGTLITRRNGKVVILGNCPSADVVIMARPTASLGKYLQMIGRVLRYMDGKVALVIDHVSNVIRHGLPDKERVWTLERREKRAKQKKDPDEIELTKCKNKTCGKPYEKFRQVCPYCGFEKPLPEPASRSIEMVEGDLILLDRVTLEKMRTATVLETPGSIADRVSYASGNAIAGKAAANRQNEKMVAHEELKETIAQWAAIEREKGFSDRDIQKKFYLTAGVDVLSALDGSKGKKEFEELSETVRGWYE